MKSALIYGLRRHGRYLPHSRRSLWLHGDSPADFSAVEAAIAQLRRRWPQYRIVHTAPNRLTVDWVSARFRDDAVLPLPAHAAALRRFMDALSPNVYIPLAQASLSATFHDIIHKRVDRVIENGADDAAQYTCLAAQRAPGAEFVRRELNLASDTRWIAVSHPAPGERAMWCDAMTCLKQQHPELVLLMETHDAMRWQRAFARVGLHAVLRGEAGGAARPDVLLMNRPAEFPGMASGASAAVLGGTFLGVAAIAAPVWFAPLRVPLVVGPSIHDQDRVVRYFLDAEALLPAAASSLAALLHSIFAGEQDTRGVCDRAANLVLDAERVAEQIVEQWAPFIPPAPSESANDQGWRIKTRIDRLAGTVPGAWLASKRAKRRIDQWDALRERLGRPTTIMCLGNGPSSEDPRLATMAADALFRVNWRWQSRPRHNKPDLVFVGDPRTVHHVSGCLLAFGSRDWEQTMLLRHLLAGHGRAPEYFTLDRMPGGFRQENWWARPSNGAVMITAAAALAPEHIIIAGIDLFQHPEGRYPGDVRGTNDYAQVHRRDVDLEVIRAALDSFKGRVTIIGDILEKALKQSA